MPTSANSADLDQIAQKAAANGERNIIDHDGMRFAPIPVKDLELLEALEGLSDIQEA